MGDATFIGPPLNDLEKKKYVNQEKGMEYAIRGAKRGLSDSALLAAKYSIIIWENFSDGYFWYLIAESILYSSGFAAPKYQVIENAIETLSLTEKIDLCDRALGFTSRYGVGDPRPTILRKMRLEEERKTLAQAEKS